MRRALAALATGTAVAAAVLGMSAGAWSQEAAATITDVGWWTSNPTAAAPEGGIAVSSGPSGAITVAAVRVLIVADDIEQATLRLTEDGGVQQTGAQLQVCPTPNAWSAGPKQAMEKAPKPECDRLKAAMARNADGVWSADVTSLLSAAGDEDDASLMVVPAGSGAVPVGFEVRFKPPVLDATGSSSGGGGLSGGSTSEFTPSADDDFSSSEPASSSDSSSFSPSPPVADTSPLPSFSSAQTSGTFESTPTASEVAAEEVTAAPAPTAGEPEVRATPARSEPRGSRVGQALFFVVVSTVVAVAFGIGHARLGSAGGAPA